MKKLTLALALAGLMTASLSAGEKNLWTSFLTREVPAGCNVAYCPPSKGVCADGGDIGGYIFAYGGGTFMWDDTLGGYGIPAATSPFALNVDNGYLLGGGVGLRHCAFGGIRIEVEHLFSELPISSVNNVAGVASGAAGDISFTGTYFNLLKEINFDCLPCVTAYVGGGIGYANVDTDFNVFGVPGNFSDSDNALSYQLIAGADYTLCNNIALFLQYKAINVGETDYNLGGTSMLENFWTHNVVGGLRFSF